MVWNEGNLISIRYVEVQLSRPCSVSTYGAAEGGVVALVDGHIHVRVDEDPAAFPVLQWRLDDAAAPRHLRGSRGGQSIVVCC